MIECDVCIIGAGPGGLTAASSLAIRGRKVVVASDGPLMGYGIEGAFKSKSEFEITRHYLQSQLRPEVFGDSNPIPPAAFAASTRYLHARLKSGAVVACWTESVPISPNRPSVPKTMQSPRRISCVLQ